jgi:Peptidase inhibitor I78 family
MTLIAGALGVLALSACVAAETPGVDKTPPDPVSDACGAAGLQSLVGKDKSVLAAMTFAAGTRFIEPGMPITRDYRADRLNIIFGKSGKIEEVSCG